MTGKLSSICAIKQVMQMDVLRCKSPAMVRKEIWAHVLVYNLLRAVMAEAAHREGVQPRNLSLQGTRQVVEGFARSWPEPRVTRPTR